MNAAEWHGSAHSAAVRAAATGPTAAAGPPGSTLRVAILPAVLLLTCGLLAGCGSEEQPRPATKQPTPTAVPEELTPPEHKPVRDPRQVLALVPADAEVLTITDYDRIRDRLGVPDLTSDDLMTDRIQFWERADQQAVMLTDGLLRDEHSTLWLDYGFTQDDVDWEARFDGPDGPGYVLGFRPDQDMTEVAKAVEADTTPLEDATVLSDQHLVVSGTADEGAPVLAAQPGVVDLLEAEQESTYLHQGCLPVNDVLGPDATFEDQEDLNRAYDVRGLLPLDAFTVNVDGTTLTVRTDRDRSDLHDRKNLIGVWPEVDTLTWKDGFEGTPVADPATGRIGAKVRNPVAAANLVLNGHSPFAVCNEIVPLDEPTGL